MATIDHARPRPARLPWGFAFGIVLGVGLALAAFALREATDRPQPAIAEPPRIVFVPTALPAMTPSASDGVVLWRTKQSQDVRLGPSSGYAIIGVLPKDAPVTPVEWVARGSWVAIEFPPRSTGRGWLPADALVQPTPAPLASPPAAYLSETLSAGPEPSAVAEAPAANGFPYHVLRVAAAALAALGVPLLTLGFVLTHRRFGRSGIETDGASLDAELREEDESVVLSDEPPHGQIFVPSAIAQVQTEALEPPVQHPQLEENALTSEFGQEQQPAQTQPDELIRRGVGDFSQTVQELTASIIQAVDKLGKDVGQAINAFAQEQGAALRRQEELLAETRRLSEQVQTDAERAGQAATQATSSQDRAGELLSRLQEDRNGLTQLINDVRSRIAALSVLAAPLADVSAGTPAAADTTAPAEPANEGEQPPSTPSWNT